ncbi:hypothetical protein RR48_12309 [Papilio machaon]|uniref:Methuselah N-terminal domain-containing protein n=1 Tax=Papilio machaon TaxID=76193 RepID=A0A194QYA2_PAPMA|nr:hypothetical protein RR48_12309 [Papilio machaon]
MTYSRKKKELKDISFLNFGQGWLQNPCKRTESLNITNGVVFDNGTVLFNGVQYTRETWYDLEEDGVVTRYGCPCIGRTCLWKCCGEGQAFFNKSCLDTDYSAANPFNPPVHKGKDQVDFASNKFFYMYTKLCTERYLVDPNTGLEDIFIQEHLAISDQFESTDQPRILQL